MLDKNSLRKIYKNKRNSLSKTQVKEKSSRINLNFINNLLPKIYQKNQNLFFSIYLASGNEVSTDEIKKYFVYNHIPFSYPKIVKLDTSLQFILYKNQEFLPSNYFPKIFEPKNGEIIYPNIVILPLLAFDKKLSRLGMGGGFFDRSIEFLKKEKNIITIGLSYDFQCVNKDLPIENTDQKLDFIVTENSIIF